MYNYQQIDKLIQRYSNIENSETVQICEGCLGSGNWILTAPGKKTAIIKEVYVNAWQSTHTVKMYNKTPKKYQSILNNL
jgi:hypothetical protein